MISTLTGRAGVKGGNGGQSSEGGGGNGIYYDGDIGIILFYEGRTLTASEVKQNYNALKSRFN